MKLNITYQSNGFSRGQLLLRTLFGFIYMDLPHIFLIMLFSIWSTIVGFIAFWSILFTGRYPQSFFEFQVKFLRWQLRWQARYWNLADGYPAFGINGSDDATEFDVAYPESLSRGGTLLQFLFGVFYCGLPHSFVLAFVGLLGAILRLLSWWIVLFTGSYPENFHNYNVRLLRWSYRVNIYLMLMTNDYPPFSGRSYDEQGSPNSDNPQKLSD